MKKKKYIILIATIGALVVGSVSSLAYVNYQGKAKTQVTTGNLNVSLSQNKLALEEFEEPIMPLDEIPKELFVTTSGTYNQYLRVQSYRYWTDQSDGFQVAPDTNPELIELTLDDPDAWIVRPNKYSAGLVTLYYRYPVSPNEKIQILKNITIGNIPSELQNTYGHLGIQIDSQADGVQQISNKNGVDAKAIEEVWGVKATIDKKGTIEEILW